MVKPVDLKIKTISESPEHGVFSFDPLPKGYGHTMGNVLRRVLLTSVEGCSITQVTVKSADHQFSTLPGVKEDIVEITLNLKNIRFKKHTKDPVIATLSVSKEGLITAKDIECPSDVEVINKDSPIATITKKSSKVEMELLIESGYGYSPSEERETNRVGVIMLDALYSPVLSVSYEVEDARFGKSIDLDKVVLNVTTDGSISPKEAVISSAKMIKGFFERLIIWDETKGITEEQLESVEVADDAEKGESVSVGDLPLPTRTVNALKKANINTLSDLQSKSEEELLDIKNVGQKSIDEIFKLREESLK